MISEQARAEIEKQLEVFADELDEFKRSQMAKKRMFLTTVYRMGWSDRVKQEIQECAELNK